jgi:hypothetical protein
LELSKTAARILHFLLVNIFPGFAWKSSEKSVGSPLAAFYKRFTQVGNASIIWKNNQSVELWATKKTFEDQRG